MRRLSWTQYDVFTSRPLEGNQLAVFTDARGLSDQEMQRLARETNLAETTFIFPREEAVERERGVLVRIFTVEEELPFAGHPTLGTATCLRNMRLEKDSKANGKLAQELIELELKMGKVPVRFSAAESVIGEEGRGLFFGEMTQRDPEFLSTYEGKMREKIAALAGLTLSDLHEDLPIQTVSTGVPFAIVPVNSLEAIQRVSLDWKSAERLLGETDAKFLYFTSFAKTGDSRSGGSAATAVDPKARFHSRMIFYNGEDPATGSAAGCCISWAVEHGVVKPGEQVMIEQGIEPRRPSKIYVRAEKRDGKVRQVRVGGTATEAARGEFFLP